MTVICILNKLVSSDFKLYIILHIKWTQRLNYYVINLCLIHVHFYSVGLNKQCTASYSSVAAKQLPRIVTTNTQVTVKLVPKKKKWRASKLHTDILS